MVRGGIRVGVDGREEGDEELDRGGGIVRMGLEMRGQELGRHRICGNLEVGFLSVPRRQNANEGCGWVVL